MEIKDKVDRRQFLQGSLLVPAAAVVSARREALNPAQGKAAGPDPASVRVWLKHEITFIAAQSYSNAYTTVTVWVDLTRPNFSRRVYGFWDGGQTFNLRVMATDPGVWK